MPTAQKVLVTGRAVSLRACFAKIASLHSKQSFSFVLCLGLFHDQTDAGELADLLNGKIQVPCPVYTIATGTLPDQVARKVGAGEQVCDNLTVLERNAALTLSSGIKLAYDSASPSDILLLSATPTGLAQHSTKSLPIESTDATDTFVKDGRPKYVFAAASTFYEREPFEWPGGNEICRALALAEMGNANKERSFYAFSVTAGVPLTRAGNITPCPFTASSKKRPFEDTDVNEYGVPRFITDAAAMREENAPGGRGKRRKGPPQHYTCNICGETGHWIQDCPQKGDRPRKPVQPLQPDECWFCLSNPKLEKHLIASIGSEAYLALPKGPLPTAIPGGHILVIPIAHYDTLRAIPDENKKEVTGEVDKYIEALKQLYATKGHKLVSWEVGRRQRGHAHIQCCPIPDAKADRVEAAFKEEGARQGIEFADSDAELGDDYFIVSLPDGRRSYSSIKGRFDLQFGRLVVANILGCPDRVDWKSCRQSEAEEKDDTRRFKELFAPYDFAE